MNEITKEQTGILEHTRHRAARRLYCGKGEDLDVLCSLGLMKLVGSVSWVPEQYFTITKAGMDFLDNRESQAGRGMKS